MRGGSWLPQTCHRRSAHRGNSLGGMPWAHAVSHARVAVQQMPTCPATLMYAAYWPPTATDFLDMQTITEHCTSLQGYAVPAATE